MTKYYEPKFEDIVITEKDQQQMREADYAYTEKKTIVYNKNEEYKVYKKCPAFAISNYGNVYSFFHKKKLTPIETQYNRISYKIKDKTVSAARLVLETFAENNENTDKLQPLHINGNTLDDSYDKKNNKVNLTWSHFGQDPEKFNQNTILSDEQQKYIKQADYTTGKKTIVYNDREQFKVYPKNNNFIAGNYGSVYNLTKGKKASFHLDKDGYEMTYIGKPCGVHRIVMQTFAPCENENELQVNHIDCNKRNNSYDIENGKVNLEWCTCQENIDHAIVMNHRLPSGGNHHKAKCKEEDIWKICKLIAKGYTGRQIAEELKIEYTPQFQDRITKIRKKESWKNISDKFPEIQLKYKWNK